MSWSLNEESCGAGFCLGRRDTPVEQARLQVWRSVASWFGLGSWRWMAWLKKHLFVSRSGWLLAVATKHTEQERPSPVSERRSCCLARSSDLAFRKLNGSFEASGCLACQASQAASNACSVGPSSRMDAPESDHAFSLWASNRL